MSSYGLSVTLTGDGSGGAATITVNCDPQYDSIVSYVGYGVVGGTANPQEVSFGISSAAESVSVALNVPLVQPGGGLGTHNAVWTPPLILLPGGSTAQLNVISDNANTVVTALNARVYNFRRGVAQRTPLAVLVAALPRATTVAGAGN